MNSRCSRNSCLDGLLSSCFYQHPNIAAVGMLYEGMEEDALTCINAIRRRHDGAKRNPFSESDKPASSPIT